MKDFQILFDHGERSVLLDPVYAPYGKLGFPEAPADRPWVYANFVQTLDGVTSLLGQNASGSDIAQSEEDRWLMDLLRAHADAVILGAGTLLQETRLSRPRPRGPVFRIVDPSLQELRAKLHKRRERNIVVTGNGNINLADFALFDGDKVDSAILTAPIGAERLQSQQANFPHVPIFVSGEGAAIDFHAALNRLRSELAIKYLLCEGGPTLYASLLRAGLIDEKFLTVAPFDAGQELPHQQARMPWELQTKRPSIISGEGFSKETMPRWHWVSCKKSGDHQFNRYRRAQSSG